MLPPLMGAFHVAPLQVVASEIEVTDEETKYNYHSKAVYCIVFDHFQIEHRLHLQLDIQDDKLYR